MDSLPTPIFLGFPCGSADKESACNVGHLSSVHELGTSLEKKMAIHSSIHAWEIPWTEETGGLQFMGSNELDMT